MKNREEIEECGYALEQLEAILDAQKNNNEPPAVKEVFKRLSEEGLDEESIYLHLASALSTEIEKAESDGYFNTQRYELRLKSLPNEFDESNYILPKETTFGGVIVESVSPPDSELSLWNLKGIKPGPTSIIVRDDQMSEFSIEAEGYIEGLCEKRKMVFWDGEDEYWCLSNVTRFETDFEHYLNGDPNDIDDV